tara:strand:- start:8317 stop:8751 length:435 start_codon:yes stop_codon:yes gene_type:complete
MAYKGKYKPTNPSKYIGDPTKIIYRSLWERKFMVYCDNNDKVIAWGSEEVVIPYKSPVDGKMHRYFVDFIIECIQHDGKKKTQIIEIKPKKQCKAPQKQTRVTRKYISEVKTWGVNSAKWKAAKEFASDRGWEFLILNENHLGV